MEKKYVKPQISVLKMDAVVMAAASDDKVLPSWNVDGDKQGYKVSDTKAFENAGIKLDAFSQTDWGEND